MNRDRYVAGIFIADDILLVGLVSATNSVSDFSFSKLPKAQRFASPPTLDDCVDLGLREAFKAVTPDAHLTAISIALPGPINGSGLASQQTGSISTGAFHRKGNNWSERDLRKLTLRLLDKHTPEKHDKPRFRFHTDAGVYGLGDYFYGEFESRLQAGDSIAHIICDEGVGGSVVADGWLIPRHRHPEIGHMRIARHPSDGIDTTPCNAHSYPNCCESRVGLPALRARYGADVDKQLRSWTADSIELQMTAFYISQLCINMILFASPAAILLSGRVVRNPELVATIDRLTRSALTPKSTKVTFPGYREQIAPDFVRRRGHVDCGIFGCVIDALRLSSGDQVTYLEEYKSAKGKDRVG